MPTIETDPRIRLEELQATREMLREILRLGQDTNARVQVLERDFNGLNVTVGRLTERFEAHTKAATVDADAQWRDIHQLQAGVGDTGNRLIKLEEQAITGTKFWAVLGAVSGILLGIEAALHILHL